MPRIPKGAQYTIEKVSQTIDLKEFLGVDLSSRPDLKLEIGQAIADAIKKRTESGVDISGNSFKAYSSSYRNAAEFKAFGKGSKVNMTLSGEMLDSIDVESRDGNQIEIFIDGDVAARAYNHNVGDTLPKRQFFGVYKQSDIIKDLKERYRNDIETVIEEETESARETRQTVANLRPSSIREEDNE